MSTIDIHALKNGMNRCFEDGVKQLHKGTLGVFGEQQWPKILECLSEYESKGWIKIIKNPVEANEMDICVEMLSFIDPSDEPPHWPNP